MSKKMLVGGKNLVKTCLELMKEWNYDKNGNIDLKNLTCGCYEKMWWKCPKCSNEWQAIVKNRVQGHNKCRKCNSIGVHKPKLLKEWDYEKNVGIDPFDISRYCHEIVSWKCKKCGHEWESEIKRRYYGDSCPACSNHAVSKDNCLAVVNPKMAKQWHPTKNGKLTPYNVVAGGKIIRWWKCKKCGESWPAAIYARLSQKQGCPYCSHRYARKDNCLAAVSPKLAKMWDYNKNGKLTPWDVLPQSNKKVWWICKKCGKNWTASVQRRTISNGCPDCKKIILKDGTVCDSKVEAYFYLKFKKEGKSFKFHGRYGKELGLHKYDFYFDKTNTFLEVTGYDNRFPKIKKYMKTIKKKEMFVKNVLEANFVFIRKIMTKKELKEVCEHFL